MINGPGLSPKSSLRSVGPFDRSGPPADEEVETVHLAAILCAVDRAGGFYGGEGGFERRRQLIGIGYKNGVIVRVFFAVGRPKYDLVKWRAGNRHKNVWLAGEIKGQQSRGHVFVCDNDLGAGAALQFIYLSSEVARTAGSIERIKMSG